MLARVARVLIAVMPFAFSIAFSLVVSQLLPPSRLGMNRWLWWAGLIAVTSLLLSRIDRVIRRLAPLSALLQLNLVFPDEAPSRYTSALRSFSSRKVQSRLDGMREAGFVFNEHENRSQAMLDLLAMLSDHDRQTRGHSERVRAYSEMIGRELGLPQDDMDRLQWAALMHDLGKLTVPSAILNKDGRPDEAEWKLLQGHPAAGIPLAAPLADWLGEWTSAIGQHHERWDGTGYPDGFAGNDIPLGARIVSVADAYDVMTSTRSYKKPFSAEVAREEIAKGSGTQFCPATARAFLSVPSSRLRRVAGPLSWLGGIPGLQNVPVAEIIGSTTMTAASATITAVAAATITPALIPLPANAEQSQEVPTVVAEPTSTTGSTTTSTTAVVAEPLSDDPSEVLIQIPVTRSTTTTSSTTTTTPPTTPVDRSPTTTTIAPVTTSTSAPRSTTVPTSVPATTTTTTAPNRDPIANDDLATVAEGQAVTINVVANDLDPDAADTITVRTVTPPANGGAVSNLDGRITYTHNGTESTSDTFTYSIDDDSGAVSTATVTVNISPVNDDPDAADDTRSAQMDEVLVIATSGLVANDIDSEDGSGFGAATVTLTSPSPAGAVVTQPGGPGTDIVFTPDPGELATQIFGYSVCDGDGACDSATVTVDINPGYGILISEFSTANAHSTGNFVELYNGSAAPIDIEGWQLRLADGDGDPGTWDVTLTITGANTVIPPGGHYLIGDASDPIAASSDQPVNADFGSDLGIGVHDGTDYVDIVGNRVQSQFGGVDPATLVDGRGVSPLHPLANQDLSFVRRPAGGNGHCQDVDDNQYDWERVAAPTPESSAAAAVPCTTPSPGTQATDLVISEFRTNGPASASDDFIELFNPTASNIDLSGLEIRDQGGTVLITLPTFQLQPGQHYLIAGGGYPGTSDQGPASVGNGSGIEIWDPFGATQIDFVDLGPMPALPQLGQRLFDTYERRDGGCRSTGVWTDDFTFQMVRNPQTTSDPFTPCP